MMRGEEKSHDDFDLLDENEDEGAEKEDEKQRWSRSHNTTGTASITDGDVTQTVGEFEETNSEEDNDKARKEEWLQEAMTDQLDVMLAIILKIRANEEFAMSIYANCPRLQNLLDQHPDLRPVFEDPNLIRINFEEVYRKAGGVLPEDKPNYFRLILKYVVSHPLFKVFRFLLLIKKLYTCIMGSGIAMAKGIYSTCFPDPVADVTNPTKTGAALADGDIDEAIPEDSTNELNRQALNNAADYMETPEVQARMQELLENNPDNLPEVIEQDPELKALRDANPLCAELMNDPETMKILMEPDNLRALGECPDLIAADFTNPEWSPPDVEGATFDDGLTPPEVTEPIVEEGIMTEEVPVEGAEEVPVEEASGEEVAVPEEEDAAVEEEEEEGFAEGFERGEEDEGNGAPKKGAATKNKSRDGEQQDGNRVSSYVRSLGTGLVDYVAGETVGVTMTEFSSTGVAEEDIVDLAALDEQATEIEETVAAVEETTVAAEEAEATAVTLNSSLANLACSATDAGECAASDDFAGAIQDNMDKIEEAHDKEVENAGMSRGAVAATAAGGAVVVGGGAAAVVMTRQRGNQQGGPDADDDDESINAEDTKRSSVFGLAGSFMRGSVVALSSAATTHLATSLLGDDLGAGIVEKLEDSSGKLACEEGESDGKRSSVVGQAGRSVRSSIFAIGEAVKEHVATTILGDDLGDDLLEKLERDEDDGGDGKEDSDTKEASVARR